MPPDFVTVTGAIWAWLSLLEPEERLPLRWSVMLGSCLGIGLLLKGLIAVVFPVLAGMAYMALTRQLFSARSWRRLTLGTAIAVALIIARAMACGRNAAQPALLCVFHAQCSRRISRLLLVLFHQ